MINAIEIEGLRKEYPSFRLEDIRFSVPKGYITGFIGPNGAGKTTTLKAVLNMISYEGGNIRIFEKDSRTGFAGLAPHIGVVMDNPLLVGEWTADQAERAISSYYPNWDRTAYRENLKKFGIARDKKIKDLSRGTKVKFSLAVALSHGAKLLVLDEPTSGLDPSARDELCEALSDFVTDEEHSVLFSTHITADLEKIADYIVFILNGSIVFSGLKEELIEKYVLVRGGPDELESCEAGSILGVRRHGTGFEGMMERGRAASLPRGVLTEDLTLDEIIVFMNKEAKGE